MHDPPCDDEDPPPPEAVARVVRLTPELERFVQDEVRARRFDDPGQVIRAALRLLAARDPPQGDDLGRLRAALRGEAAGAIDDESLEGPQVLESLRRLLQRRDPPPPRAV